MIKMQYPETMSHKELYNMIESPDIRKMKDAVNTEIKVSAVTLREDGEQLITSIRDESGEVFATNSPTVYRSMMRLFDIGVPAVVEVITGTSRAGRTYTDIKAIDFKE